MNLCTELPSTCCTTQPERDTEEPIYWVIRSSRSWDLQSVECYLKNAKLAAFESKRETDCMTKYLLDEYGDDNSMQYAIGTLKCVNSMINII